MQYICSFDVTYSQFSSLKADMLYLQEEHTVTQSLFKKHQVLVTQEKNHCNTT